ncbi:MAG TPA: hypothetical protein VES02_06340 [Dermatophilaceae bacterium]|nr:hypothetical protein [Dermatophilaceae bacterium]
MTCTSTLATRRPAAWTVTVGESLDDARSSQEGEAVSLLKS